jgi:hypothetical protein
MAISLMAQQHVSSVPLLVKIVSMLNMNAPAVQKLEQIYQTVNVNKEILTQTQMVVVKKVKVRHHYVFRMSLKVLNLRNLKL